MVAAATAFMSGLDMLWLLLLDVLKGNGALGGFEGWSSGGLLVAFWTASFAAIQMTAVGAS